MIIEAYVSFETAKLLKEKGFNEECSFAFYKDGRIVHQYDSEFSYNYYDRPTLQMAMKWLREVHSLYIEITLCIDGRCSTFNIMSLKDNEPYPFKTEHLLALRFNTYEQACEAAIKYCLENLI